MAIKSYANKAAYDAALSGECDVAILPIENSYAGEVGQTMDLIFSGNLYINGIYELEIHQNLLGLPDATIEDIKKVTSHPQALSQCHDYIKMRGFKTEEANNTALAAKAVAEANDKSFGAIASVETAEIYGLKVIEANINKSGENTTRFAVFSRVQKIASRNDNRFIMMFTVKNEPGSLGRAVSAIGENGKHRNRYQHKASRHGNETGNPASENENIILFLFRINSRKHLFTQLIRRFYRRIHFFLIFS